MKIYLIALVLTPFLFDGCGEPQKILVPVQIKMPILSTWVVEPLGEINYTVEECEYENCETEF